MLDYLNSESEEVKTALAQLSEAKQALQQVKDNYRPSILNERYLTGEEVCRYLHVSPRTCQTLRDTRQIPFTVIRGRVFLYPESGIQETLHNKEKVYKITETTTTKVQNIK